MSDLLKGLEAVFDILFGVLLAGAILAAAGYVLGALTYWVVS